MNQTDTVTRGLFRLGRWCARNGLLVLGIWLAVLVCVGAANRLLPPPSLKPFVLAGTDSASAQVLMIAAFPGSSSEAGQLVIHDSSDLAKGDLVDSVVTAVRAADGVSAVKSPAKNPDLMSTDHHTAIILVTMAERAATDPVVGQAMFDAATSAAHEISPDATVALGGYMGQLISRTDTRNSEAIGLFMALIVLLITLRRGWPVAIPIATAMMAVGIGLTVIKLLGRMVYIPEEAPTLGTMLGLGVGIDYALFLLTRHRRLLHKGFGIHDSVGRTAGTAGAGMVFAGATLLAAVSGLALTGISFLAWLGYSAAIVVAIALCAALTLVPALMGLMGPRVLPKDQARAYIRGDITDSSPTDAQLDQGRWARIATAVTSKPWRYTAAAGAFLLLMAAPMLTMKFQQIDSTALPDSTPAHIATDLISEAFGPGVTGPLAVVAQLYRVATPPKHEVSGLKGDPRTRDPRLTAITETLAATPGVDSVNKPVVSTDGGVVIWRVVPSSGPSDPVTERLVASLRTTVLPEATDGQDMVAFVGGLTAARTDLTTRVADRLLSFIIGVVTLSFVLLLIAYRSLVIPIKAAAMNLISISAAYGVVVMVFQWGWGAAWIGLDGPVPIESYVPMMMFAILFGLSMDYEVFLLTAFQEHYQRSGVIVTAIRRGLADTGQVITSAALIMVVVFVSFILPDNSVIKMFGVGLATAILVDATIVRCVLVPALMVLAAKQTWWLPRWLDAALPHLHVEGDPAALESIDEIRTPQPQDALPGSRWWATALGVGFGWMLGVGLSAGGSSTLALAIALAALGGGLLAWLPRDTRFAGKHLAARALTYFGGAGLSAMVFIALGALSTGTSREGLQISAAVLVPIVLAAITPIRTVAIPFGLGVVTSCAALGAGTAVPADALTATVVPTLVAMVLARVLTALRRPTGTTPLADPGDVSTAEDVRVTVSS